MAARWTTEHAGTIFDGSFRTGDEVHALTVLLGVDLGWRPDGPVVDLAESTRGWLDDLDDTERLADAADRAVGWLTEHIAPDGHVFEFDDGLVMRLPADHY